MWVTKKLLVINAGKQYGADLDVLQRQCVSSRTIAARVHVGWLDVATVPPCQRADKRALRYGDKAATAAAEQKTSTSQTADSGDRAHSCNARAREHCRIDSCSAVSST